MLLSQGMHSIPTTPASAFPASGLLATTNTLTSVAVKWSARVPAAHVAFPCTGGGVFSPHEEIVPVPVMSVSQRPRMRTNTSGASAGTKRAHSPPQHQRREQRRAPDVPRVQVQPSSRPAPPPPPRALNPNARSFTPQSAVVPQATVGVGRRRRAPPPPAPTPPPSYAPPPPPYRIRPGPQVARRVAAGVRLPPTVPILPSLLNTANPFSDPTPSPASPPTPVLARALSPPLAATVPEKTHDAEPIVAPQARVAPATAATTAQPGSFMAMTPAEAKAVRARILANMLLRRSLLQERPVRTRIAGVQRPYIRSRLSSSLMPIEITA